jgi:arsenate reductase
MSERRRVLFLCTHNAARSQMAEGYVNSRYSDKWEARSAGVKPGNLNPYAVRAMAEIGIDISSHRSKPMSEFRGQHFHYVVTVCSDAADNCPFFPGDTIIHMDFPDPSAASGTEEQVMGTFRYIRDEIIARIDLELPNW